MKTTKLTILICFCISIGVMAQKPSGKINNTSSPSSVALEQLVKQKSDTYNVYKEHTSRLSGIHHMYLRQAIDGIEVYGTESSVHFDPSGTAIKVNNKFLNRIEETVISAAQNISAEQAITSVAAQMGYSLLRLQKINNEAGIQKKSLFNKAGISSEEIPVKLMYYYQEGIGTTLIWELSIAEITSSDWWNFRVDAATGQIIDKDNWTLYCAVGGNTHDHTNSEDDSLATTIYGPVEDPARHSKLPDEANNTMVGSYTVYAMPVESPFYGNRTTVANPENLLASPFGWHDTNGAPGSEFTNTRGNNVSAYDDDNSNNLPDGKYAESPGGNLIFNFPLNTTYSGGDQSEDAAITNLFYWSNIIHDVMYQYGFDEASGNFQENNYGNGGAGNDSVNAEAQDGSGTCNANFGTPGDGANPRMQMFVCGAYDGDLDNWVIVHEYGHGISNRLNTLGGAEQMGEGWSDFYGLLLTMVEGVSRETPRGFGSYAFFPVFNGDGARTQPYSTDFAVNNFTYDSIKSEVAPHGVGSVWAEMLWEMTWELIDLHGFSTDFYNGTGGNNVALALVTEGLKLQPANAGFVDGRDAILAADMAIYGGVNQCAIWDAFARRGLGFSAVQGSSASKTDGTEAFDLPPGFSSFSTIEEVCMAAGIQTDLAGGFPLGGVYSGVGVTDDGNGETYTLDPSVNGAGTITISYLVDDLCTGAPAVLTDDVIISNDPPAVICRGGGVIEMFEAVTDAPNLAIPDGNTTGVSTTISITEDVIITDLNIGLNVSHTWVGDLTFTITSPLGTSVVIYDRPGVPASQFGCGNDTIDVVLDDEGTAAVEGVCGTNPAISGVLIPNNPLSAFDGESTAGTWTITAVDLVEPDPGTLNSWTLEYTYNVISEPLTVSLNADGNITFNAEDLLFDVQVACGGFTVDSNNSATVTLNCSNVGMNTIPLVVTGDAGASAACSAQVIVEDPFNACACPEYTAYSSTGWSNGVPGATKGAIIASDYSTTLGSIEACSLTIQEGNELTISAGTFVKVESDILVSGTLIIDHEGSLVQVSDAATVTNNGTITVEKITPNLSDRAFMIIGSPMMAETRDGVHNDAIQFRNHLTENFTPNTDVANQYPLAENFADDNGDNWLQYTGIMNPGEGYLIIPQSTPTIPAPASYTFQYTQSTLTNGIVNFDILFFTDQNSSPNVLANPYASAIDAESFMEANEMIDVLYFWEHLTAPVTYPGYNANNYDMGDISLYSQGAVGGIGLAAANGGNAPTQYIASGQGFVVKPSAAGTAVFTNSMRITDNNTTYRRPIDRDLLWLRIHNEMYDLGSNAVIGFSEVTTSGVDFGTDVKRLATPVSLYSELITGEQLAINVLNSWEEESTVSLSFATQIEENREYRISIKDMEGVQLEQASVFLIDNELSTITYLNDNDYLFYADAGTYSNRFTVIFRDRSLSVPDVTIDAITLYPNPAQHTITIATLANSLQNIRISDIRGRVVQNIICNNEQAMSVDISQLDSAVYFVSITTDTGTVKKRIVKE